MWAIFKREIKAYFLSSIGYIFLSVFYLFSGYFFYATSIMAGRADLKYVFSNLLVILIFLLPMLTMKLMSEDKKLKTDQLLLTSPVNLFSVVFGKFLAALTTLFFGVLIMFVFAGVLCFLATSFDWIIFLCNVLGLLLLGSALISIGIFISSLTENQVISVISSCAVILLLFFIDGISATINMNFISKALSSLSIIRPYNEFTYGLFSLPNIVLFFSFTIVFLFLTARVLEKKRWAS
ncbi:MAG: ABC transporter permease subunit [Oscillospiraceae bacterium]|nr:ABC transporter permease subunit [Oscillospiraceae bacterium]